MKSIKAIIFGSSFVIFAMLVLQLAFIFIAVGYNSLAADIPFLKDISGIFRYLIGIPVFIATLFIGGYIAAANAEIKASSKVLLHCLAVGVLTVGSMLYFSMDYMAMTAAGIVIFVLAQIGVVAGGLYWLNKQPKNKVISTL